MRSRRSGFYRNTGLLLLRIGIGIMFALHGYPKMFGGPEVWTETGKVMSNIGIHFAPMFFGFMAGVTEFFGGIFLALGLFFKTTNALLFIVMVVAAIYHISAGDSFSSLSHPIELGIVFLSLFIIGPGKHSLDHKLSRRR